MYGSSNGVRTLGNLSDQVTDAQISPHLENAARQVRSWLGPDYDLAVDDKLKAVITAENCLTLSTLLPTIDIPVSAVERGVTKMQHLIGETDMAWLATDDIFKLAKFWRDMAYQSLVPYMSEGADISFAECLIAL
jgi:hypothetical protein